MAIVKGVKAGVEKAVADKVVVSAAVKGGVNNVVQRGRVAATQGSVTEVAVW